MSETRIAFLIDTVFNDRAGTERQLLETIRRLDKTLFKPYLICLRESEWMKNGLRDMEYHVLDYKGFLKPSILSAFRKFYKILREERIQIIQSFFEDSQFFAFISSLFLYDRKIFISARRDIGLGKEQPWYHTIYRNLYPLLNKKL